FLAVAPDLAAVLYAVEVHFDQPSRPTGRDLEHQPVQSRCVIGLVISSRRVARHLPIPRHHQVVPGGILMIVRQVKRLNVRWILYRDRPSPHTLDARRPRRLLELETPSS